jgi:hypothetical protein
MVIDDARIRARDGRLLAADVFYPDDGEQHPVLLMRGPYLRAAARAVLDVTGLTAAGWALVIGDIRGRGDSEGDGAPFIADAGDGADTLDWCVAQPWCDGRVAGHGSSYLGFTQWQMAGTAHPALRAIAPVQTSADAYRAWFDEGGALLNGLATQYGAYLATLDPGTSPAALAEVSELTGDLARLQSIPPAEHPLRRLYRPYDDWIRLDRRAYWDGFNVSPMTHRMDVAGYHVAGWYDLFCDPAIELWRQMREHAASEYARASQRLVVGFWPHGMGLQALPEVDYGPGSDLGSAAGAAMYPWLRSALDGEPVEGGASVFVMGVNRWLDRPDWPPPSTPLVLHLDAGERGAVSSRGDGALRAGPGDTGSDRFVHDPADPVPTHGGKTLGLWRPLPGPHDQRDVERRDDVLVYSSVELSGDLTIVGAVRAAITFETTGRCADVAVKLVDVHPDGRALNILDAVARRDYEPGVAVEVEVALGSVGHAFRAGHRIRVEVASSNAPRLDVNRSTGRPIHEPGPAERATQRVHRGGTARSQLILPVIDNLDGSAGPHLGPR